MLLGFLTGLTLGHHLPVISSALLATGFCGAYSTFSTFTYESVRLLEDGQLLEAAGNVAVSVAVGLGAATLGLAIGLASEVAGTRTSDCPDYLKWGAASETVSTDE